MSNKPYYVTLRYQLVKQIEFAKKLRNGDLHLELIEGLEQALEFCELLIEEIDNPNFEEGSVFRVY